MARDRQQHWEDVYTSHSPNRVSWYESRPDLSLALLHEAGLEPEHAVIDVGGGASRLVDFLIAQGQAHVSVLDISSAALDAAKTRLGNQATQAKWIVADIVSWSPDRIYDYWHDRAAFHFLVDETDQQAYVETMSRALSKGGIAVIGTFALDGPEKCSGLPIIRHDVESLGAALGSAFELVSSERQTHLTPWGSDQHFQFGVFRKMGDGPSTALA